MAPKPTPIWKSKEVINLFYSQVSELNFYPISYSETTWGDLMTHTTELERKLIQINSHLINFHFLYLSSCFHSFSFLFHFLYLSSSCLFVRLYFIFKYYSGARGPGPGPCQVRLQSWMEPVWTQISLKAWRISNLKTESVVEGISKRS